MKRRKLAQRVTSAVLSACMMFTLSSPALAESTSALMELSADRGVSVLSEENSAIDYGIEVGSENDTPVRVTSENYTDILGNGVLSYDPVTETLQSSGKIRRSSLQINAPGKDVILDGGDQIAVDGKLIIIDARDVTVKSNQFAAIYSSKISKINCTGKLTLISENHSVVMGGGGLTVENAGEVEISANNVSAVLGVLDITNVGDVKITNIGGNVSNKTLTISAQNVEITTNDNASYHESALSNDTSITVSGNVSLNSKSGKILGKLEVNRIGGPYVYFLSDDEDAEGIDGTVTPITAEAIKGYLRIEDKVTSNVKVNNGTLEVGGITGTETTAFNGQKVTVTATGAETELTRFDGWELDGPIGFSIRTERLAARKFFFIMPSGSVELTAQYANKVQVTNGSTNADDDFAREGETVTVTAQEREGYQFDHWKLASDSASIGKSESELKQNPLRFKMPGAPVKMTAVYKAAVTVVNGTADKAYALEGETVTVTGHDASASFSKFVRWEVVSPKEFTLSADQKATEEGMTFTMPDYPVKLKAIYSIPATVVNMPVIVTNGTINDGQSSPVLVKPGEKVRVKANAAQDPEKFHHWKIEKGTCEDFELSEAQLTSEEISFIMPQGAVKLTAIYSVPASVQKTKVTVENGTAKSTLGSGSSIWAVIGSKVEITADEPDQKLYPGMEFDYWEITYPDSFPADVPEDLQLKLADPHSADTSFEMPRYEVKLTAHFKGGAVTPENPDDPMDPGFGQEDDGGGAVGAIIVGAALGGAAIWGGYEIITRVILHNILPEGAAIPANRGELAVLIWQTAGKPEPAEQPAFADVEDAETAQAAQWCVEQGLMEASDGKFDPAGWMPKFKTIGTWNKAFPKQ